ncbi:MAG: GNAT family N-acetyltransferase [Candidatus Scalindua sp.]|nr:GNAT family N-acetyltransferase [Candidatus Scalindua sp.]
MTKKTGEGGIKTSSTWLNSTYGIQQIILGVDVRNINAIKAYQKCGFNLEETPYIANDAENQITMI